MDAAGTERFEYAKKIKEAIGNLLTIEKYAYALSFSFNIFEL